MSAALAGGLLVSLTLMGSSRKIFGPEVVQQYLVVTDTPGALVDTRDPAVSESITRALAKVSLMAQLKRMARGREFFFFGRTSSRGESVASS